MDVIRLENMVFYGYHGVSAAEKETGRRFEVDCELETDLAPPGETDLLKDTVDYVAVYQKIKEVVEGKAYALLESLATHLAKMILEEFDVFRVTLRVRKIIPPIAGNIDHIEIEVTRHQGDTSKILADNENKD
ncbi:MAG: dihydroneopterin aldolase [Candidatus Zixiibacteriota bacterium]